MAELELYNTMLREKEVFQPLHPPKVGIYDCGPTVYFYAHIGNMWRYVISDILRRVLEYNGYKVKQVMNITDVGHLTEEDLAADTGEDKILMAAKKEKKTPEQIAKFYGDAFFKDRKKLNILEPHIVCKATEHIADMIELIKKIEQNGYAYWAGEKYFVYNISKFKDYGKLSGKKLDELEAGTRLEPVPGKKNPFDFALWIKDPEHLMRWDSPWGVGYPGWHIECAAMSMKYLGATIDVHTGGEDNVFPHHENEIAQAEAATNKQFVRYWIHVRHNLVDSQKMSKSKGNFYILQDIIGKGFNPLSYRYLCLNTHYRTNLNFSWEALKGAENSLENLYQSTREIRQSIRFFRRPSKKCYIEQFQERFLEAINDDLNMPRALAVMWQMIKDNNVLAREKYRLLLDFDRVFGLGLDRIREIKIPKKISKLVESRERYRKQEKFEQADEIRKEIEKMGYRVEDGESGARIKPLT